MPFDIGFTTRDALGPLIEVADPNQLCKVAKFNAL